ncbi:MAG: tyrosine-type recombinase/integrase [Eubacteriales bacterium]|nr:tyrosine-type recombinase/integrase [Eubacteriales bacterium]
MEEELRYFIAYLETVKRASRNTVTSYHSDLVKMAAYLHGQGIDSVERVSPTALNAYVLKLEGSGMAASTISRYIASMKAFFEYLLREHRIQSDPAFPLKAPRVEKKEPGILTVQEMEYLLEQPSVHSPKGFRDKAMLELLYATGMRVSELIRLQVEDVNLRFGWVLCRDEERERMVPFGAAAGKALMQYLERGRNAFVREETGILFLNCSGAPMSRQGFWKILKGYAEKAGIDKDITPRMFRHSCAAHMAAGGAGMHTIQELLGYADPTAAHIYAGFQPNMKVEYSKVHPRG